MQQLKSLKNYQQMLLWLLGGLCIALLLTSESAFAGEGGTAFKDVWDTLTSWIQGMLGRVICGAMVLVGIIAGIARQSLMAFAVGIGGGIGLYNIPTIVTAIVSADLSVMGALTEMVIFSNGLS